VAAVVRVMPVLFACRGCERDRIAREAAAELDRRGLAEASVAGDDAGKARSRYPVFALEGCHEACAARWLATQGVTPVRSFVLDPAGDPGVQLEAIAAAVR
jgi:uncharacterized metal-binding protein